VFLEADAAWEKVGEVWQRQVDNYGLLQLDITWCLLKLVCVSVCAYNLNHVYFGRASATFSLQRGNSERAKKE
jgi:hypothetical protein